jgi:tetratricopeptide (TPR) repeat protein
MRALLVVSLLTTAMYAGGDARAEPPAQALASAPARSPFWRSFIDPNQRRAEQLVRQGRAQLYPALGLGLLFGLEASAHRRVAVENALARFERAVELAPDYLEARLLLGKALALREARAGGAESEQQNARAIAAFEALRRQAPLYEAEEVALSLGNVHMRAGEFSRAVAEYTRALAMSTDDADQAMLLGNLAEATMMGGDLTRALAFYERALRVGQDEGRVLALWGGAVALDRMGEHGEALARALRALREDRAPFAVLRQSGVFFVPAYESYYYEALGALALAGAERESNESLAQTLLRARSWIARAPVDAVARFSRVAHELRDAGQAELANRWFGPPGASASAGPSSARTRVPTPPMPGAAERAASEELPATGEARALFWALRALAGFAQYVQRAGEAPYAEDAQQHVRELSRLLAR